MIQESRRLTGWRVMGRAAALVMLGAMCLAQAQAQRVIGVMSLIADEFLVIGQEGTTGTKLDQNVRESVPIEGGAIERVVLGTVMKSVAQADASAKVLPMLVNEPRYYRGQRNWVDGEKATLPPEVTAALRGANMTHLILVAKHRADTRMSAKDISLGSGRLEGLGFYVDRITTLRLEGTSERTVGYLAPYVYASVTLIDLAAARVVAKREITRGQVVTASQTGASGGDPWGWLDSKGKLQALSSMIEREVGKAAAEVVKP